jgi:hypothetical protein
MIPSTPLLPIQMLFAASFFNLPADQRELLEQQLRAGTFTLRAAVAQGYASAEAVEEWVDFWHEGGAAGELRDFLGMNPVEYVRWMKDDAPLAEIFGAATVVPVAHTFSTEDYIPMSHWGRDHWSTLGYAETVMAECGGFQVGADARMKSNRRNFRVMAQECARPKRPGKPTSAIAMVMQPEHATKLNDGQVVDNHDDWSCLQDMAAEGLFVQEPTDIQPGVILTLSEKGNAVANALREFKRNKGQYAQFRWPGAPAAAPSMATTPASA